MGEVCVALRENGKVKTAIVHKCMLNAFQDVRWFAAERKPHPLDILFKDVSPENPLAPYDYGLVVIDRDTRWLGSHQSYMAFGRVELYSSGHVVRAVENMNLDEALSEFDQEMWPSFFVSDGVRTRLLCDAHEADATQEFMDADWSDDDAQWQPLSNLETDNLADAVDALTHRRRTRNGGGCRLTQTFFRFLPDGWTINDYSPQSNRSQAFIDALVSRNLVTRDQVDAWHMSHTDD